MKNEKFTTFQVAKAIGEKYPRLRGWIDVKAVVPSIQEADGIGSKAFFSRSDVYLIGVFKECLSLGFSRDEAASAIRDVRQYLEAVKKEPRSNIDHILFVKRNGSFFHLVEQGKDPLPKNKKYKTAAAAVMDSLTNIPARTVLLDQEMFDHKPLKSLLSWKGLQPGASDYTALVVINFSKIVSQINAKLG